MAAARARLLLLKVICIRESKCARAISRRKPPYSSVWINTDYSEKNNSPSFLLDRIARKTDNLHHKNTLILIVHSFMIYYIPLAFTSDLTPFYIGINFAFKTALFLRTP